MRWELHSDKDKRIVKRFALFPVSDGNEVVWLETYYMEQQYEEDFTDIFGIWLNRWNNLRFVDKEDYDEFKEENK